jgi:hypothetical protein
METSTHTRKLVEEQVVHRDNRPAYSGPQIEDLEIDENLWPEMDVFSARSGMGNCKHTYI